LLHAIFSRVVCLLFSLLFNVRSASQQLVAVAGAFTAKILNKLLPHLQLRKKHIYKKSMHQRAGIIWRHSGIRTVNSFVASIMRDIVPMSCNTK